MNLNPSEWMMALPVLLGLTTLALLGLWLAAGLRARRLSRRLDAVEQAFAELRTELGTATGVSLKAEERLRQLDPVFTQMADRLGQLELRGEGRPYDQAIALAQRGGDADRLVSH